MGNVADELVILIRAEVASAVAGLQKVQGEADKTASRASAMGDKFKSAGKKMSLMATLPIVGFIGASVKKFGEQEKAIAEVTSTIDSMGVAWTTASELQQRASELQSKTTFGDEEILHMQSVLLTFGNITEEVFGKTEAIALDMSAALGQDLQSSAVMLGKALNDPAVGLSALSRVGVSFTEQQKEQIKAMTESGDLLGAQTLMMSALEDQFEGSAEAIAGTHAGKMKQAMNDFGDAMETVGGVVAPILASVAGGIAKVAQWFQKVPGPIQKIVVGLMLVVAAVGPLLWIIGVIIPLIGTLTTVMGFLGGVIGAVSLPVLAVVAAIAAAIAIGWLIYKNWDTIFNFVKGLIDTVFGFIQEKIQTVLDFIMPLIEGVLSAISGFFTTAFEVIRGVVMFVMDGIMLYIKVVMKIWETIFYVALWAIKGIFEFVLNFIQTVWETVWNAVGDTVMAVWEGIINFIKTALDTIRQWIQTALDRWRAIWDATLGKILTKVSEIFTSIKKTLVDKWNEIKGFFTTKLVAFQTTFTTGFNNIKDAIMGVWDGLVGGLKNGIKGAVNFVIDQINWLIRKLNQGSGFLNKIPGVDIGVIPEIPNLGFGGKNLGGSYMVGDRGKPEMVNLPQGSSVTPLGGGGGGGITIHLNAPQNDPLGVAREVGWELTKRGR